MFDLEERLLEHASEVIRFVEKLPRTRAGTHVAAQLSRCGTSALPNHTGEAQAAESAADFVHKMSICLKELRETNRWLRLCQHVPLVSTPSVCEALLAERDEPTRIFVASIRTARRRTTDQS